MLPAVHPFVPLPYLRTALAVNAEGAPSTEVITAIHDHVWTTGGSPNDPSHFAALVAKVPVACPIDSASVKAKLRENTAEAVRLGVFGVPTWLPLPHGPLFWGADAMDMLYDHLTGNAPPPPTIWPEIGARRRRDA